MCRACTSTADSSGVEGATCTWLCMLGQGCSRIASTHSLDHWVWLAVDQPATWLTASLQACPDHDGRRHRPVMCCLTGIQ